METGNETKVISIKDRSAQSSTPAEQNQPAAPADFDWGSIMKKNSEGRNSQQSERDKANKGVIRSYRLKH